MQKIVVGVSLLVLVLLSGGTVAAQVLESPSYSIPESYIGPGGSVDSSSPSYRGSDTIGDISTGESSSPTYGTVLGFNTPSEPRLAVLVGTGNINFGSFSTAATATATATFKVLNYTSHGYGVYTIGAPPDNGTTSLAGMGLTNTSQTGVEQYGMNLRANTSPIVFGSDPVQVPSGSFSFGAASSGYNTTNNYRYNNGEKIAESVKSSGETSYTISYIINTATNTPGGDYVGAQNLVVVGTY